MFPLSVSSLLRRCRGVAIGLCMGFPVLNAAPQPIQNGPVHEAFISKVTAPVPLGAVSMPPPAPLLEKAPPRDLPQSVWINGYWAWMPVTQNYVWVTGCWRCPPPGKQWIPGYWKTFEEGSVWIRGFWSDIPQNALQAIEKMPPDQKDENADGSPSSNYFWAPGYWKYADQTKSYDWIAGRWEEFDPEWVYVPAQYVWRPEGYFFVPAYWDWANLSCGHLYTPVIVPENERKTPLMVDATMQREPHLVLQELVVNYPNYTSFLEHHHRFHPEFWLNCYCAPPWWGWDTWWTYTWHDQWALWWWYTHPGYPSPSWLNEEMTAMIDPPSDQLIELMKSRGNPPSIVTPMGVVAPSQLLAAIEAAHEATGSKGMPIFSMKDLDKIQKDLHVNMPVGALRPMGDEHTAQQVRKNPPLKALVNPVTSDTLEEPAGQGRMVQMPPKPSISPAMRVIQTKKVELKPLEPQKEQPAPAASYAEPLALKAGQEMNPSNSLRIPRNMKQPQDFTPKASPTLRTPANPLRIPRNMKQPQDSIPNLKQMPSKMVKNGQKGASSIVPLSSPFIGKKALIVQPMNQKQIAQNQKLPVQNRKQETSSRKQIAQTVHSSPSKTLPQGKIGQAAWQGVGAVSAPSNPREKGDLAQKSSALSSSSVQSQSTEGASRSSSQQLNRRNLVQPTQSFQKERSSIEQQRTGQKKEYPLRRDNIVHPSSASLSNNTSSSKGSLTSTSQSKEVVKRAETKASPSLKNTNKGSPSTQLNLKSASPQPWRTQKNSLSAKLRENQRQRAVAEKPKRKAVSHQGPFIERPGIGLY